MNETKTTCPHCRAARAAMQAAIERLGALDQGDIPNRRETDAARLLREYLEPDE